MKIFEGEIVRSVMQRLKLSIFSANIYQSFKAYLIVIVAKNPPLDARSILGRVLDKWSELQRQPLLFEIDPAISQPVLHK